ncbi:MAG: hypothetical protein FD135_3852 [Comamonadaceae bacterium]|nr:MAG: hypothetical protein FD135_3852 [Comamonadaceae bacterium]
MSHTTNTQDPLVKPVLLTCAVCMKEIPLSEAVIPEALDYVVHFCSPNCYEKWHLQKGAEPPTPSKAALP